MKTDLTEFLDICGRRLYEVSGAPLPHDYIVCRECKTAAPKFEFERDRFDTLSPTGWRKEFDDIPEWPIA